MGTIVHESQSKSAKPNELPQQSNGGAQGLSCESADGFTPFPKKEVEGSVSQRFEKLVCMHADRIAVKTAQGVVTYAELNGMANRMAHTIISRRGTEAEAVAILLEKGPQLMAAMLAVLKAGKFFVLLDLSYPKARLAAVLKDSEAALIISDRHEYEEIRQVNRAVPSLLEFDAIPADAAEKNLGLTISPGSLAAVVYTSGSTGEPKGVMRAQRNLLHQTMLFANAYKLSTCDRLLLTTSGTANALSISFLALLTGAALLPFDVKSQGVRLLVRWIVDEKITICWMGSPLFRNMCRALTGGKMFSDVRILRLSSEVSFKSDIELYKRHFSPECQLFNGLSSTEAGLICLYPIHPNTEITGEDVPVGYPVEDKEVLLLDDSGKEVGPREVGEIAIRSQYLCVGYWHRPELTKDKFKADPTGIDERVYLSGDLGLMLADGSLIHKGRKDFRVKIRGYGVEIAEIEKLLNTHPAVGQAVVVARKNQSGDARLIAYYTRTGLLAPTVSDFRAFLRTQLPDYMIPSTFLRLEGMPMTESGKIDRRMLPDPDKGRPDLANPYISSRNPIEQRLVAIWEDTLDVYPIGINDGFFDLGGDSLSASRAISRVIKHFELEIPLQLLFQSPTIAAMAAVVAQGQHELLGDDKTIHGASASLVRTSPEDLLPLSYSQQRLWFLDQLDPGSSTYNLFSAYQLKGALNVSALEQSFNEIIRRHEILRTVFKSEDGDAVQVVLPSVTVKILFFDLRAVGSLEERWEEARRMFTEEAQRHFDLATGPLLRITLLQLIDDEHLLLRATHHIVSDGWSQGVLFRELSEIYAALMMGKPSPLADLPTQYADYTKWQRQWFDGERLSSQLSYWKKRLDNLPTLHLPTDRPRQAVQAGCGARRYFAFTDGLSSELKKLSRQHGATLFMTLLAAFQTLFYRYSGQTDVVIGSPVAGRSRKEFEELIGLFVNMLVLRLDLSGNPTFTETIARVREVCLAALSNQELPFEKLVEELHPDRRSGRNPLFQVSFAFQNTPRVPPRLSGITVEELEVEIGIARFDLHLVMEEIDGHLKGYCDYDTNLFNAETIERMLGHFQTLLEAIAANPDQCISDLPLLTDAEKHQILVEWNDTRREYPKDKCIHQLFEEQVEKTPDAIAVAFEDQQISYWELNSRANQLSHYLQKLGVGPDVLVGICLDRSIEMIVGLLASLKAGGAYVPLDPSYPNERLAFMLEDSRAAVLITRSSLIEGLPVQKATVLCLNRDWDEISTESQDNPPPLTTPDNLAYVIYTSGSTGTPKGALIPHHNIVRLFSATDTWFHFGSDDVWTLFHSYAFDFSVWELWGPLVHGGRLVIVPLEVTRSPGEFYELLCREQVTVLNQTPSAFRQLVQAEESITGTTPLGLRLVIFGGEALDFQMLRPWFERHGDQKPRVINMFGITETTVHVTYRVIKKADLSAGGSSLIGVPIRDLELYVLDSHRNLVPVGVPGELYVGGAGLARGYLNRAELTAERFVSHPFDGGKGRRMYRSGDLVRRRSDGEVEYLGRIDNQVKIRGHRIELGEIESILAQHGAIQQAVVLAREDTAAEKRLVAYIVPAQGSAPNAQDLRGYLKQKLPDYMVPSAFVFLDSLPLTANGKLDRKALPAPDGSRLDIDDAYAAPTTPMQEILANIWAEVLKLDKVGIQDNFFDLGGHSLLAMQVVSRINTSFQTDLPLRRLFDSPTIAGLADWIQDGRGVENDSRRVQPIVPVPRTHDTALSFAQERLWFLDRLNPDSTTYNIPAAFHLTGDLNVSALEQSLNEVVRRHEALRTVFANINGNPVQTVLPSLSISLTPIDVSDHPENQPEPRLETLLREEAALPFDLGRGPLIRARLWRLARQDHVLALTMHHIVSDGWSMGVLFHELSALYGANRSGQSNPLRALPVQYADYSVWQRNWLQGEILDKQLSYWRKHLDGLSKLQLPTDRPRPAIQTYRGATRSIELSAQLSGAIQVLGRCQGVTLFMILLAAFQILISRYCGQSDIAVGTPIAGRIRREIEGLIGFFVNTLVLRSDLSNNPTLKKLLRQVHETTLEAYTHQDLPFEKLVKELHPERDLSNSPLFQVLFALQNASDSSLALEGLNTSQVHIPTSNAKFDLFLAISQRTPTPILRVSLNYNTDLFDDLTIERMLGHFQVLLEGIVANPDQPISELPLLTDAEKHQLLVKWNDTEADYPKDKCVHELFETQVEKTPNAIALVFEEQQLTYRELNNRANQLAHYLIREGLQPENTVGIYLDRSIELAVALLAVLKAGGVYVPIDTTYPSERIKFILQDVQASFVLSTQSVASQLSFSGARVVTLDTELPPLDCDDHSNRRIMIGSQAPAYILYTSGSTGTPKGVVMSHRAFNNLTSWQIKSFGQGLPARTLQFASLGFDVSIQEMFSTWCSGGSLHLIPNDLKQDSSCLLKYIEAQSIERIFLPLVALQQLAEIAVNEPSIPQSLRDIVTAGEQLRLTKTLRLFLDRVGNCRLYNQYGPTESHVVTQYTVNRSFQEEPDLPPIGRPIANTEIYIVDSCLNPVPAGIAGEILIGGDGLAQGYLNRPELTAQRFIGNPFGVDSGSRLYKTGDLARYLPDGNIEFLGRIDSQVKIRGHRIEPGEIESVLAQHPAIEQAVVLAREDTPEDRRLVAYMVATEGSNPSAHDLRSYLQYKLPEYMVPSAFVFLGTMPLTRNGKLDRNALPAPDQTRHENERSLVAPGNPLEEAIARIWAGVLGLETIGIHDNFFDLGGHSLKATQVMSRVREALGVDLPLRVLFESPTVAGIALKIDPELSASSKFEKVAVTLAEVESLSEEEVKRELAGESTSEPAS